MGPLSRNKLPLLVGVFLVVTVFAGCINTEDGPVAPVQAEPVVTAETGSIQGEVLSGNLDVIEGARVTLIETITSDDPKEAVVDKTGKFVINGVVPGTYTVWAEALLHNPGRSSIDVKAGSISKVSFLLEPIPDPNKKYVDQQEKVGKIDYAVAHQVEVPTRGCIIYDAPVRDVKTCGGLRGGNSLNGEVKIMDVPNGTHTIFAAMVWQPAGPLGEYLSLDLLCEDVPRGNGGAVLDTEHPCYFDTPGRASPLIHRVDKAHWEEAGYNHTGNWSARVFSTYGMLGTYDLLKIDAGVAYEQAFTIYTEVWVNHAAPEDHRPVPDA